MGAVPAGIIDPRRESPLGSTRPDEGGGYRWSVVAETSLPTSEPPAGDLTGRLLAGRYRLTGRIASGGMAQVWEATDEVLTRRVAVKILHPHLAADSSFVGRFRGEAVAAARLAHPSIVSVYDTFRDQGVEAIVMELVRGTTLRARLDEHGALDVAEVLGIGAQVADALDAAHQTGLVHRDIKPANILLSADGRVLVADFGIAKAAESGDFTTEGLMVGTAKYVAPEQVEGKPVDGRTDVYSLGIVLYESLCGRAPFRGETDAATALQRLHAVPLRPRQVHAEIPRSVEAVVMRSMERDPSLRYPDAGALRGALLSAGADPADAEVAAVHANGASIPIDVNPGPTPTEQQGFVQSERDWLVPAMLVIIVAVALGVAGVLIGKTDAGQRIIDQVTGKEPTATAAGPGSTTQRIGQAVAYDPNGDDKVENDDLAALAIDGNLDTAWQTSRYDNPDITVLKPGVGLVLRLGGPTEVTHLTLTSPTGGWTAKVYAVEGETPPTIEGWGQPLAEKVDAPAGGVGFDLAAKKADAVLIWFTHVSPDGRGRVAEVQIQGR